MSGGSYDYLFAAGGAGLVGRDHDLERMADRLAGLGYAEDAARETVELLQRCRQFATYADVIIRRLSLVWGAVEWWDSGDSNEDEVRSALVAYRSVPRADGSHG